MTAATRLLSLPLRHPFGISRGTTSEIPVFFLDLGGLGWGEGSPVRYKGEGAEEGARIAVELACEVTDANLDDFAWHAERARAAFPDHRSARACFDIALHDAVGRRRGVPLSEMCGASPAQGMVSSFTIALDSDEVMLRKVEEAAALPILKIKLGRSAEEDARTMRMIRAAAPGNVLRVDANAGWTLEAARAMLPVLADLGVEFVEQPLAIGNLEELAVLRRESSLPIIADEDALDMASLPALIGKVDGINIKLMKCGGLWEARRMIAFARDLGWKVMLGCMIESSLAIAAASHLLGLADACDLDAELLIAANPCAPRVVDAAGRVQVPCAPGVGVGPMVS